jgi:hypothetical protein
MEPIEVDLTAECLYRAKPCGVCGRPKSNAVHKKGGECSFRRQNGCAVCGQPKNWEGHLGAPPSFNALGVGDTRAYLSMKKRLEAVFAKRLRAAGLRPCGRIVVEGEATFPDRGRRDQGNFRVLLEKALGDALTAGGWLEDDDWTRYEFGGLAYRYEPGVSRTRLILFPSAAPTVVPGQLAMNA